ncbi:hypothetical protein R5R35_011915 [Gryllus longicercus]|uniref:Uncharacterized protein n=1 Tax=Gryllus longicercus TaxID=2509291 RepID=A0AAN9ZGL1_9ORTH
MAGKPEPPQHHIQHQQQQQQQPPSVQNVVVYVSNDNFTQAYAVNHQNVASYQHQSQQNGSETTVFNNSSQSVAPLVVPGKTICKPPVKTQDFSNNGLVGSVADPHPPGFYATSASGVSQTNGFHHCHSPNVINNLMYSSNNAGHSGTILNPGFSAASLKNIVNLGGHTIGQQQAVCPNVETPPVLGVNGELCNGYAINPQQTHTRVTVSCAQPFFSGQEQKSTVSHSDASSSTVSLSASNYLTSQGGDGNFVTVMGGDGGGAAASSGSVVFPRCDSVRSETAESSCSSLSSADSQPDGSGSMALLLQSAAPVSHQAATTAAASVNQHHFAASGSNSVVQQSSGSATINNGMMMLNNNVNVQHTGQQAAGLVRTASGAISLSQQQLGNIVLAMTVNNNQQLPAPTVNAAHVNQTITPAVQLPTVPTQTTITVPFGWKRLNVNGSIVYIRSVCQNLRNYDDFIASL